MKNFSGVCQAAGADKPLRAFFIWITNIVTLSVKLIDEGLYMEQSFDERKVRDSECLVYYEKASPFGGAFFVAERGLTLPFGLFV